MSSPASSSSISFTRLNCCRISCYINHWAVACAFSGVDSSLPIPSVPVLLTRSALPAVYSGQNASTCCTVCVVHPHPHFASIPGTFIDASHQFSPITSVRSRNSADAWCFGISEYNFRVLCSPQSSSSIMGGWNCKVASLALFSLAFVHASHDAGLATRREAAPGGPVNAEFAP